MLVTTFLWFLPVTDGIYDYRTDNRTDEFNVVTDVGETSADTVLSKTLYDNDTQTLSVLSDLASDIPVFASYNGTNRAALWNGLTANATRNLDVSYDTASFDPSSSLAAFMEILPWIWMIAISVFPLAALAYIWWGKVTGTA